MTPTVEPSERIVALLKFDVADSTGLKNRYGGSGARECLNRIQDAVGQAVSGFSAEGDPVWDGDGGKAYFVGEDAALRAAEAGLRAVEGVRTLPGYEAQLRAAVGVDCVPASADLTMESRPDFELAGHMLGSDVCPPNAVSLTEDAYRTLLLDQPELAGKFSLLGTTARDDAPVFASPAGKRPAKPGGLKPPGDDAAGALNAVRAYHSRPPFSRLRFYAIPQFNFAGSLDLLKVFTPLKLRARADDIPPLPEEAGPDDSSTRMRDRRPPRTRERPPAESLAEALRRRRSLILLGDPGSGKTTILRYLAVMASGGRPLIRRRLGLDEQFLPLFVTAAGLLKERRLHPNDRFEALLAGIYAPLTNCDMGNLERGLKTLADSGGLMILVDGLDELPDANDRVAAARLVEEVSHAFNRCRFIVSSRLVGYPGVSLPEARECVVEPLEARQAGDLAGALYAEVFRSQKHDPRSAEDEGRKKGRGLIENLRQRESLGLFAENPLLLALAALVHLQLGELPRYRVRLYDVAAQTLVEAWAKARRPEGGDPSVRPVDYDAEGRALLAALAFHIHEKYPGGLIPKEELFKFLVGRLASAGSRVPDARDFLSRLEKAGSLLVERGPGQWGFSHQTFQEYFAAKHLAMADRCESVLLPLIFHPRWEETIVFAAGEMGVIQGRQAAAGNFIWKMFEKSGDIRADVLGMNRLLAARCLADTICSDAELEKEIVEYLLGKIAEGVEILPVMGTLGKIRGTSLSSRLAAELRSKLFAGKERDWTIMALVALDAKEAIPDLQKALRENKVAGVRSSAAGALGRLGATQAVPDLLKALREDRDEWARANAAEALGDLGATHAVPDLLKALREDKDEMVRSSAAEALGGLGATQAVPDLFKALLEDKDLRVRSIAAEALGRLGVNQVAPKLIKALREEKDWMVRENAAGALGRLGATQAVPDLLKALSEDKDCDVRSIAAIALGRLGATQAVPNLLKALREDDDEKVRFCAAMALGELYVTQAVPDLLNTLREDKEKMRRRRAAFVLGSLGATQAVPDLLKALREDKDEMVRRSAAYALGDLGATQAVPDLLKLILDIHPVKVRRTAATTLYRIAGAAPDDPCWQNCKLRATT